MMHGSVCVCVCLGTLLAVVSAYPGQVAEAACKDMTPKGPGHDDAKPQRGPLPKDYTVTLSSNTVRSGDSVEVVLKGTQKKKVSGMMVQCLNNKGETVGSFKANGNNAKTISCFSENDTGSHNSPNPKTRIEFIWESGTVKGPCTMYVTWAETKQKFWIKEPMGNMQVV